MQAYEHIMASTIIFLEKGNKTKENALEYIRNNAAFNTYPDSVRSAVAKAIGVALRQTSHSSENAGMQFIFGDELKNIGNEGYPKDKLFGYEGLAIRAADKPTDLNGIFKHNPNIGKTKKGRGVLMHLVQDSASDDFFQGDLVECHIEDGSETVKLYGNETKGGYAIIKRTGKKIDMGTFRSGIVNPMQELVTFEVFKRLMDRCGGDLTFEELQGAVFESYDRFYPESMQSAKIYAIPDGKNKDSQVRDNIVRAYQTGDMSYYKGIKEKLVDEGYFESVQAIDDRLGKYIDSVTTSRGISEQMTRKISPENLKSIGAVNPKEVEIDEGYPNL